MCNPADLMADVFVPLWGMTCVQINTLVSFGEVPFACDSTEMNYARRYCCDSCNFIFHIF